MITSSHNPRIQWVRKLQSQPRLRRETGAFVVEGVRLAEEALASGWEAQLALHSPELDERGRKMIEGFMRRGVPVEMVSADVLRAVSDTQTPQGILAVLSQQSLPTPQQAGFIFIADGVRDPGNLGSMLRSAAAAGADLACLAEGCADPWAPKVLRAAMGAHFHLPLQNQSWDELEEFLNGAGVRTYLADANGGIVFSQADFRLPLALIIGAEAEGASPAALRLADERVHIPMPGGMESLNAAAAAAILLFEVVRQRRSE
jgi:TrmH family RNA methyltransferase